MKRTVHRDLAFVGFKPFDDSSKFTFFVENDIEASEDDARVLQKILRQQVAGIHNISPVFKDVKNPETGEIEKVKSWLVTPVEIQDILTEQEEAGEGARGNSGVRYHIKHPSSDIIPISVGLNLIIGGTKSGKTEMIRSLAIQARDHGAHIHPVLVNEPGGMTSLSALFPLIYNHDAEVMVIDSISALDYTLPSAPARKEGINPNVPLVLQYLNTAALLTNKVLLATYNIENVAGLQAVLASQAMSCLSLTGGQVTWYDYRWLEPVELWGIRDTRGQLPQEMIKGSKELVLKKRQRTENISKLPNFSETSAGDTDVPSDAALVEAQKQHVVKLKSKSNKINPVRSDDFIEEL